MLILIDPNSGVPTYRQVVDQIRFQIDTGRVKADDELPSTRALSLRLGVNPMTISKAYGILEGEGLLTRRPGLPLVVAHQRHRAAETKLEQLTHVLQPAALAALQLGISEDKATTLYRKLMDHNAKSVEKSE